MDNVTQRAIDIIVSSYRKGGKVLVCGNGGSAADADHIVGELMKGFLLKRPLPCELRQKLPPEMADKLQMPLRAINLSQHTALSTAFANDVDPALVFAQQVLGYADEGDVFIGISTSGNSYNILCAARVAKALGAATIGMTGADGGKMNGMFDLLIKSRETATHKVQEDHVELYHKICISVEKEIFR
jgi:phosphoheptose isomerase